MIPTWSNVFWPACADLDDTNGIQGLDERRDVLRLESLILLVQLHLRKALQVHPISHTPKRWCQEKENINTLCEPEELPLPEELLTSACTLDAPMSGPVLLRETHTPDAV